MVSLRTALIIQGNDVNVYPFRDGSNGKFGYEVSYLEGGNYRPLLTHQAIYDSEDLAKSGGDAFVAEIKALDLSEKVSEIEKIIGKGR